MNQRGDRLTLTLDADDLTLRGLLRAGSDLQSLLDEIDSVLSHGERSVEWLLGTISHASPATIELVPRVLQGDVAQSARIAETLLAGLGALQDGTRPARFSDKALQHADGLADRKRSRAEHVVLTWRHAAHELRFEVTERVSTGVRDLRKVRHRELGSVEGRLEVTSIRGFEHVNVAELASGRNVECRTTKDVLDRLGGLLGRRVVLRGEVAYDALGRPVSVRVESFRVLAESGLPGFDELVGLYSDLPDTSSRVADYWREGGSLG